MASNQNGHQSDDMPEMPDMEIQSPEHGHTGGSGATPGGKGLLIQPFPGGGGNADPIRDFMHGSDRPEQYLPLTNMTAEEIAREERIMVMANVANYANCRIEDVLVWGHNARRGLNGQASKDIVSMVIGHRVAQQQKGWQEKQGRMFNQARGNSPLNSASNVVGS